MKFEWDFSEFTRFANSLNDLSSFENAMTMVARDIAKVLLVLIKAYTPSEDGTLVNGWNGNKFVVTKKNNGFEVLIVNDAPYALWVNDGHKAYNQHGGPYKIKRRVKVKSPHKWQKGDTEYYVFGHFFVERGIVQLKNTKEIEKIILGHLKNWWKGCLNG